MPAPLVVPITTYSKQTDTSLSNISVGLDATVLRCWRDSSEFGTLDPEYPYYAMEIKIHSFPASANSTLARYTGGKLKKGALYQLQGRWFVPRMEGGESYLHIDQAIRFQGPGIIKSFRVPRFKIVGQVVKHHDSKAKMTVEWTTKDPYRRDMVYEQSATLSLDRAMVYMDPFVGSKCWIDGTMEGLDHKRDWVCTGVTLA